MDIYRLDQLEAVGEFGEHTHITYFSRCDRCHLGAGIKQIVRFHLHVLGWSGSSIVSCAPEFAITAQLHRELELIGATGYRPKEMVTTWDEECGTKSRTEFVWLGDIQTLQGPPINYKHQGVCEQCGREQWVSRNTLEEQFLGPGKPARVSQKSWSGQDIFRLPEPASLIVTERFLNAITSIGGEAPESSDASWV